MYGCIQTLSKVSGVLLLLQNFDFQNRTALSKRCLSRSLAVGVLSWAWKSRLKYAGPGMALSSLQSGLLEHREGARAEEMTVRLETL
jgi:hypothetical protein